MKMTWLTDCTLPVFCGLLFGGGGGGAAEVPPQALSTRSRGKKDKAARKRELRMTDFFIAGVLLVAGITVRLSTNVQSCLWIARGLPPATGFAVKICKDCRADASCMRQRGFQKRMVTPMSRLTLLYVTDDPSAKEALERSLSQAAFDSVLTSSSVQALALLFVNRKISAVVLDQQLKTRPSFALARAMRSLRPDVPIVLLSQETIHELPNCLDACICTDRDAEALVPVLNRLVTERWENSVFVWQH